MKKENLNKRVSLIVCLVIGGFLAYLYVTNIRKRCFNRIWKLTKSLKFRIVDFQNC